MTLSAGDDDGLLTADRKPRSSSKKRGRRKRPSDPGTGEGGEEEGADRSLHLSDLLGETVELDEEGSDGRNQDSARPSRRPGKGVPPLQSLAARRREFEFELLRRGLPEAEAFGDGNEEDVFTFYAWSASRQPRPKIERERKLLRDTVRQGVVETTKDALVRMK